MAKGHGISAQGSEISATLTAPTIVIDDGQTVMRPPAKQAFAAWDVDNDGILRDAEGSGGIYPLYPSSIKNMPVALAGNRFENGANIVLGYFINETGRTRFLSYHLFTDPTSNAITPRTVTYGDTEAGVAGTLVWVSPGVQQTQLVIQEGDPARGLPNIVQGIVIAPTLASDSSIRNIEYTFRQALLEQ